MPTEDKSQRLDATGQTLCKVRLFRDGLPAHTLIGWKLSL
jgi:hypothetical protein